MKKLFRFMSREEFEKLIKGENLKNNTKHQARTNSVGFCFMEGKEEDAEYSYEYLSSVVSDEVCVLFETDIKLNRSYGIYANPYGSFFSTITEEEYCIEEYNKKTIKPIKYCTNFDNCFWKNEEWEWKEVK